MFTGCLKRNQTFFEKKKLQEFNVKNELISFHRTVLELQGYGGHILRNVLVITRFNSNLNF